eukprot:14915308-Alexandrium_andersonii.AAC.1
MTPHPCPATDGPPVAADSAHAAQHDRIPSSLVAAPRRANATPGRPLLPPPPGLKRLRAQSSSPD